MTASERFMDLERLAADRAGVVTRAELSAAGWNESAISRAAGSGPLIRVATGVFRVAGAPTSAAASRRAAVAAAGPGAVLARWSAAELLGLIDHGPRRHQLLVPHGRRPRSVPPDLAVVCRTRTLSDDEVVRIDGLPATTAARTTLDLASSTTTPQLAEIVVNGARLGRLDLPELQRTLDRHPAASGRGRVRDVLGLLADDGDRARSEAEIAAVTAIVDAGLPRPVLAHRILDDSGRLIAEVDLAYPRARLAIEIDGYRWHASPARKAADEVRQNRLVLAGWTVLRFSAAVVRQDPAALVRTVAAALA